MNHRTDAPKSRRCPVSNMPRETRAIIGFSGPYGSGKDECYKVLAKLGWHRVSFADPVREAALKINPWVWFNDGSWLLADVVNKFGWDVAKKSESVRRFLQRYAAEGGRDIHGPDCWVKIAVKKIEALPPNAKIAITDVRFPNEIAMIRRKGGKIYRVENPRVSRDPSHASEQLLEGLDGTIINDGSITDLATQVMLTILGQQVGKQNDAR